MNARYLDPYKYAKLRPNYISFDAAAYEIAFNS